MSKELLLVIEAVANEKGVDRQIIVEAMESALAMATRKKHNIEMDVRVSIDPKTGVYDTFRQWTVVKDEDDVENEEAQLTLAQAQKDNKEIEVGDVIEEQMPSIEFGRIAAQTAKQVIVQKVREAEREKIIAGFQERMGKLVNGTVKRVTRDFISVDLGGIEGSMPRAEWIPREAFRSGDRIKCYLKEVVRDQRGAHIILSRACNEMLVALFKIEVPEIAEDVIQVKAVARDPGSRAKIAVYTNDRRIDPVGACVGMRGARVQAISNELAGERVDIIMWDDSPAQFVINAMAPAEVLSIVVDEDRHSMDIAVVEDQLSLAIGKGGQNVRLAAKLSGWSLNVMADTEAQVKQEAEKKAYIHMFVQHLEVDEAIAQLLVDAGFTQLEEVAHVNPEELLSIAGFDQEIVNELQERAKNVLLTQALTGKKTPAADLLKMQGMDAVLAHALAERGIVTMEDLAEQAVDDLLDLPGIDAKRAGELIMTARAPWFAGEKE